MNLRRTFSGKDSGRVIKYDIYSFRRTVITVAKTILGPTRLGPCGAAGRSEQLPCGAAGKCGSELR